LGPMALALEMGEIRLPGAGASAPWTQESVSETDVPASGRNIFDVDDLTTKVKT
jgi:hypothetical protein